MASLDSLLRALAARGTDSLWLEPGKPPRFLAATGGEVEAMARPLDGPTIGRLLAELSGDRTLAEPLAAAGSAAPFRRFDYPLESNLFECRLTATPEGWSAVVTVAATAPPDGTEAAAPAPTAISTAVSAGHALTRIQPLLDIMLEREASDVHLSTDHRPRLRIHGELAEVEEWAVASSAEIERALFEIAPERNREQFAATHDTDFAYDFVGKARFRVNLFRDHRGMGAVLRQIPQKIPSVEALGLPDVVRKLAMLSKGLVLVTGPTGSGKSTTLAAIIDLINRTRSDHILTIEDPIEFVHPSKKCLVNQREVGTHTGSFKAALRAALREDPDVVLVGEMRDLETIAIAIETAETGHLVFGTLHTTTAPSTVERLVDQFPGDRQAQIRVMLADSLRAVIAQTLLRKIGGGRVAALEILISTPAIANLIREGKTYQIPSAIQTGRAIGMAMLNDSLLDLVERKIVEPKEAYLKAVDKDALAAKLRAMGDSMAFLRELQGNA